MGGRANFAVVLMPADGPARLLPGDNIAHVDVEPLIRVVGPKTGARAARTSNSR